MLEPWVPISGTYRVPKGWNPCVPTLEPWVPIARHCRFPIVDNLHFPTLEPGVPVSRICRLMKIEGAGSYFEELRVPEGRGPRMPILEPRFLISNHRWFPKGSGSGWFRRTARSELKVWFETLERRFAFRGISGSQNLKKRVYFSFGTKGSHFQELRVWMGWTFCIGLHDDVCNV